jgi:hypothetical protein
MSDPMLEDESMRRAPELRFEAAAEMPLRESDHLREFFDGNLRMNVCLDVSPESRHLALSKSYSFPANLRFAVRRSRTFVECDRVGLPE